MAAKATNRLPVNVQMTLYIGFEEGSCSAKISSINSASSRGINSFFPSAMVLFTEATDSEVARETMLLMLRAGPSFQKLLGEPVRSNQGR
jgi:hypothetical protein